MNSSTGGAPLFTTVLDSSQNRKGKKEKKNKNKALLVFDSDDHHTERQEGFSKHWSTAVQTKPPPACRFNPFLPPSHTLASCCNLRTMSREGGLAQTPVGCLLSRAARQTRRQRRTMQNNFPSCRHYCRQKKCHIASHHRHLCRLATRVAFGLLTGPNQDRRPPPAGLQAGPTAMLAQKASTMGFDGDRLKWYTLTGATMHCYHQH